MRFKFVATRVETVERWIRATDEEDATRKAREELERPFAFIGEWQAQAVEVRIVASDSAVPGGSATVELPEGKMLRLKDAAATLGISYGTLHKLVTTGEIEHTKVGSRILISRESLDAFVKQNTRRG
jgi:excisionase family DNA binding protein